MVSLSSGDVLGTEQVVGAIVMAAAAAVIAGNDHLYSKIPYHTSSLHRID
jgi:hypothetical protein